MDQGAALRLQQFDGQFGQRAGVAGRRVHLFEAMAARRLGGGVADRENRDVAPRRALGQGADAVRAGQQNRLHAVQLDIVAFDDFDRHQRLAIGIDAYLFERLGKRFAILAGSGDQCAHRS